MSVPFEGETTEYETFVVHRDTVLTIRCADRAEFTDALFGLILQRDEEFKLFSYVVD